MLETNNTQSQPQEWKVDWDGCQPWSLEVPGGTQTLLVEMEAFVMERSAPGTVSVLDVREAAATNAVWTEAPSGFAAMKARVTAITVAGVDERIAADAAAILAALEGAALLPARAALTADREVAFVFFGADLLPGGSHRRVATITCGEEGPSALQQDRAENARHAWDFELEQLSETIDRVRSFVAGQ
jgi:hypothetical protein